MLDEVGALLREVAATIVLPAFGRLAEGDVEEKAPGEIVTVADRAAEAALTPRLEALLPGSTVVGEEAVAADPRVVDRLAGDGDVWVLDPIDGTRHFAAGRAPFAVMCALRRRRETVAAWILQPLEDRLLAAELGAGATVDGRPTSVAATGRPVRGSASPRYLPADVARRLAASDLAPVPSRACAGAEYPDLVGGPLDVAVFWRTLPWDHLPGVLLLTEAGGVARRPEGDAYDPADHDRRGLVAARSPEAWEAAARAVLGPPGSPPLASLG